MAAVSPRCCCQILSACSASTAPLVRSPFNVTCAACSKRSVTGLCIFSIPHAAHRPKAKNTAKIPRPYQNLRSIFKYPSGKNRHYPRYPPSEAKYPSTWPGYPAVLAGPTGYLFLPFANFHASAFRRI